MLSGDVPPEPEKLKISLYALCSQYGRILDLVALKTPKLRGQAGVVFSEITAATNAFRGLQDFDFYDKRMRVQYAKAKSDCIAKVDGSYAPGEKRKKQEKKGLSTFSSEQASTRASCSSKQYPFHPELARLYRKHDAQDPVLAVPWFPGSPDDRSQASIAFVEYEDDSQLMVAMQALQGSKIAPENPIAISYAKKSSRLGKPLQEPPVPPNNILFIQNLPDHTTSMMLQIMFQQFPGFQEVRMIKAKPGIAFVEHEVESQSMVAMQAFQGFKIAPENPMAISYAKKKPSRLGKPLQVPPVPPNNILFIQNLPDHTTSMMLQILFQQFPGFREVRMIEAKPGIAFVEY